MDATFQTINMPLTQQHYKSKLLTLPNLILALYLVACIVKYILGTEGFRNRYFVLMFIFIFTPYVLLSPAPYKKYVIYLFVTMFIGSSLSMMNKGLMAIPYLGNTIMQLGLVGFIFRYRHKISEKIPEYTLYVFLLYVLIKFIEYGDFEEHFAESSRNTVSWLSLSFCALYYLIIFLHGRSPTNFIPPLLTFIIAVVAQGRSGIVTTLLFLIIAFWHCSRKMKSNIWIWIFSVVVLIGMAYYAYSNLYFFDERLDYFREKQLEDASRTDIIKSYISSLNMMTLITGSNLYETVVALYHGNPHNSYILGHVRYGIMVFIFYLMQIYAVMKGLFDKNTRFIALILLVLSIRILTDMLVFMYPFDFIIYILVITLLAEPKEPVYEEQILYDNALVAE